MRQTKFEIFFEDDHKNIKCGKRIVTAEIGDKWVYLTFPFKTKRVIMSRERFYSLSPRPYEKVNDSQI